MNLLLVDDELLVLNALQAGIDWGSAGIDRVFTSRNITAAKKLLSEESVQIVLCDIEMPGGSGLELLSWIQEQGLDVVCIMLTCHADFDYCVQTLQLRGFDYIVKPAPNEQILEAVRRAVNSLENQQIRSADSGLLERNRIAAVNSLWLRFLFGDLMADDAQFRDLIRQTEFPLTEDSLLDMILIQFPVGLQSAARQQLRQLTMQVLGGAFNRQLDLSPRQYLYIFPVSSLLTEPDALCRSLVQTCSASLGSTPVCIYATEVPLRSLPDRWHIMASLAQQDTGSSGVRKLSAELPRTEHRVETNASALCIMLLEGQRSGFLREVRAALTSLGSGHPLNQSELRAYTTGIMNTLYDYIRQCYEPEERAAAMELISQGGSVRSVSDFQHWLDGPVSQLLDSASLTNAEKVVERVKRYIHAHLSEKLLCENIARQVYLNPDYLERVFKREVGMTLTDYITSCRLSLAAELIRSTNLPISSISQEVGYSSFSYFSKLFKRHTGLSPRDYRHQGTL